MPSSAVNISKRIPATTGQFDIIYHPPLPWKPPSHSSGVFFSPTRRSFIISATVGELSAMTLALARARESEANCIYVVRLYSIKVFSVSLPGVSLSIGHKLCRRWISRNTSDYGVLCSIFLWIPSPESKYLDEVFPRGTTPIVIRIHCLKMAACSAEPCGMNQWTFCLLFMLVE